MNYKTWLKKYGDIMTSAMKTYRMLEYVVKSQGPLDLEERLERMYPVLEKFKDELSMHLIGDFEQEYPDKWQNKPKTKPKRPSKEEKFSCVIPFGTGRPARNNIINNEDLVNMKIALETCQNLEEFINET